MNIGKLFVSLGLKGGVETVKGLKNVNSGLSEAKQGFTATKAALAGLVFGMQRLMSNSMRTGIEMDKFATLTGLNAVSLQKWQYAMIQSGGEAEDFQSSLINLQKSITMMTSFNKPIAGFSDFVQKSNVDTKKLQDTFYLMERLQDYATKVKPVEFGILMDGMGIGKDTQKSLIDQVYNEKNFSKAQVYNKAQIAELKKVGVAWKNLYNDIEKAMGTLNAKIGPNLIEGLTKLTQSFITLATAAAKFADQARLFQMLSHLMKGLGNTLDYLAAGFGLVFEQIDKIIGQDPKNKDKISKDEYYKAKGKTGWKDGWMDKVDAAGASIGNSISKLFGGDEKAYTKWQLEHGNSFAIKREYEQQQKEQKEKDNFNNVNITVNQSGISNTHDSILSFETGLKEVIQKNPVKAGGY